MKALRITLYVITGIALLLLSLGVMVPSNGYPSAIVIKASPEKCWAAYHDTKQMAEWWQGFKSLTLKSGDLLSPGSRYEIIVNDKGHRLVMSEKIMEIIAPNRIWYELNNDVLRSAFSFSFERALPPRSRANTKLWGTAFYGNLFYFPPNPLWPTRHNNNWKR